MSFTSTLPANIAKFTYPVSVERLELVVSRMRWVEPKTYVVASDINLFIDFVEVSYMLLKYFYKVLNIKKGLVIPELENLLDMLYKSMGKLKKVYAGDIVYPDHHNSIAECLLIIRRAQSVLGKAVEEAL